MNKKILFLCIYFLNKQSITDSELPLISSRRKAAAIAHAKSALKFVKQNSKKKKKKKKTYNFCCQSQKNIAFEIERRLTQCIDAMCFFARKCAVVDVWQLSVLQRGALIEQIRVWAVCRHVPEYTRGAMLSSFLTFL